MPRSGTATRTASAKAQAEPNAIELLTQDHKDVKSLFRKYQKLAKAEGDPAQRHAIAQEICEMLTVHAQIEEEIFYPAAREVIPDEDLLDEAVVEHATAKELIARVRSMSPDDELYDATVKVLGEYVDHHVKEEQEEMFPKLRRRMDIDEIGARLQTRKNELMSQIPH